MPSFVKPQSLPHRLAPLPSIRSKAGIRLSYTIQLSVLHLLPNEAKNALLACRYWL